MSIVSNDLKFYGSAVMPDDDVTANVGGVISTVKKVVFTDITPEGLVEMLSSEAGDTTQTVTIYGRNTAGEIISETKTLNGLTVVDFTSSWERILKVIMSATATGTITIRKDGAGGNLITLEPGITQVRRPFYNANAPVAGTKDYFEKIFCKNTHATLTLVNAVIIENADPSGKITFGLEDTLDDSHTVANRLTAPAAMTFDSATKNVANSQNLTAGSAQGTWLKLSLASTDIPANTTYTVECQGGTT